MCSSDLIEVDQALTAGSRMADRLLRMGLIRSVALSLQGETRVVGDLHAVQLNFTPAEERMLQHA